MAPLNLTGIFLAIVDWVKPFLIKVLPINFLRSAKRKVVLSSIKKIDTKSLIPFEPNFYPEGINLIGFIRAEIGLGQSCRLVARQLDNSQYDFDILNYQQISAMRHEDISWDEKLINDIKYGINIMHINPYEMPIAFINLGREKWDYHYNIAFWLWELEEFPQDWVPALNLVDEIWAPSEFSLIAIRKITDKPTFVVPYAIEAPTDNSYDRHHFKLPDNQFLFLSMYDSNSTIERKNPLGAIKAFKEAFPIENPLVGIIIKINNPQSSDLDLIKKELENYKNVYLISAILSKTEVNSLLACTDVFVSLHRCEGFGLPIAEAMLLGTPVIATNWSSNTEFMTPECSCLVDFDFVTIEKTVGPYEKGNRWADANILQAAQYMLKLFSDKAFYKSISDHGSSYIKEKLSMEQATEKINKRITNIYNIHGKDSI